LKKDFLLSLALIGMEIGRGTRPIVMDSRKLKFNNGIWLMLPKRNKKTAAILLATVNNLTSKI
jgi:hypothetical protein